MEQISIKPKIIAKKMLSALNDRAYDVIVSRFGLNGREPKTLEAIGNRYGITRERVRQIEAAALATIRKSDVYNREKQVFEELKNILKSNYGGLASTEEFLGSLSRDKETQNYFRFYLILCPDFYNREEDEDFHDRWTIDETLAEKIENSFSKLHESLSEDRVFSEDELVSKIIDCARGVGTCTPTVARAWLNISKKIKCNPLGEWGFCEAPHIRLKGIKDYAHLVLRRHGSPLHFTEVAKIISETFNRKVNVATCHNELIKDKRFVVVGRGKYALAEWGYRPGVVREVIEEILRKHGPLSREEIIKRVLKERFVEKNTILVNLQNPKYFRCNRENLFDLA